MSKNNAETSFATVMAGGTLSREATAELFTYLIDGNLNEARIAALLAVLHARKETADEIAGAAAAFIAAARPLPTEQPSYDSCGTGGDGAHTINISTAAALVAASDGIRMAKHGNRSVSSTTGSADVLEAFGIPLNLDPAEAAAQLDATNFTFLFAPHYHPAIGAVMPVRRQLAMPTLFNILGPLLNPAPLAGQLMGVANPDMGVLVANTLVQLGRPRALVVNGAGLDEFALHGPTDVWEVHDGDVTYRQVDVDDLGVPAATIDELRGADAAVNAQLIRDVFSGKGKPAHRNAIAVNAGALAYLAGKTHTLREGTTWALDILDSGQVDQYLSSMERSQHE